MPSPKSLNRLAAAVTAALPIKAPLVVVAAGLLVTEGPNSRRLNASAVHASGPAAGTPPLPPPPSHSCSRADRVDSPGGTAGTDATGTDAAGAGAVAGEGPIAAALAAGRAPAMAAAGKATA